MNSRQDFSLGRWLRSRTGLVFLVFSGIAAFYLLTEHTAHFFGILPYALLLLCPLLHLFMHSRHDGLNGHADHQPPSGEKK